MARYTWLEPKRAANLAKHGFDFADAELVLENPYRWEIDSPRRGQPRKQALAYVFEVLLVLTVAYAEGLVPHVISFRRANRKEQEAYFAWLETDFDDNRGDAGGA